MSLRKDTTPVLPTVRHVPDPSERPTITIDEVCPILGLSRSATYQAASNGEIPTIRIGRRILVPTAALRRMLQLEPGSAVTADARASA
jgi:excisionase family DNA binding protein